MKKWFFSVFIILMFFNASVVFAEIRVSATINQKTITLEDEAYITVSIDGGQGSDPVVPKVYGLDIVFSGQQSQMTYVNGVLSTKQMFMFSVIPSDKGEYTIPGFIVYIDGREYQSNELKLKVDAGNFAQKPPQYLPQNPSSSQESPIDKTLQDQSDQSVKNQGLSDRPFWLVTQLTQVEPYVSEQIIYQLKFFSRINVNIESVTLPSFDHFFSEVLVPERKGQEKIGEDMYTTYEIVYALTPLQTGQYTLEPARMGIVYQDVNKRSFGLGSFVRKNLMADKIDVDVKALPEPKPDDFSDCVGRFDVSSHTDTRDIKLGESSQLSLTLKGIGNLKNAQLPEWSFPDLNFYYDKPVLNSRATDQGIESEKEFQVAIVPTRAGVYNVPPLSISCFDPFSRKYQSFTFTVDPIEVHDTGSSISNSSSPANQMQNSETAPKLNEPKSIDESSFFVFINRLSSDFKMGLILKSVVGFIAIVFVFLLFGKWRRSRPQSFQPKKIKKLLHITLKSSELSVQDVFIQFKNYLSEVFREDFQNKTTAEIVNRIRTSHLKQDTQLKLISWLEHFEKSVYGYEKQSLSAEQIKEFKKLLDEV